MKELLIIGAGGHGKVCYSIARQMNLWDNIFFLDDFKTGSLLDTEIIGKINFEKYDIKYFDLFVAIGDNNLRSRIYEDAKSFGYFIPNLIHPTAQIDSTVSIGNGNVCMPYVVINSSSKIGNCNILNTMSVVEHDCKMGNYIHLSPSTTICGSVEINSFCWLGAGSVVINNLSISENIIIGANSLVTKNLQECGTYLGSPAIRRV